jgi:hypothetical protein
LSKIRDRYGLVVFERFFEGIVELCQAAGLVWGQELYFDGTKIRANAALDGMVPRCYWETKHHLRALFAEEHPASPTETASAQSESPAPAQVTPGLAQLVEKYDGTRRSGRRSATYQRVADSKVSPTDPDASPMSRFQGDRAKLGYHTHYVVDGGKARIILAALVTDYGQHPDAGSRLLGALALAIAAQDCGGRHQIRHRGEYCWSSPAGHSSLSADP